MDGKPAARDSSDPGRADGPSPADGPFPADGDLDGDGHVGSRDCDETNPEVHRGHAELCDGLDNDCNGLVDDVLGLLYDQDGDGYGDRDAPVLGCEVPEDGAVEDAGLWDCDDTDPSVHPRAEDVCFDGVDQDCNGRIGCIEATVEDAAGMRCVVQWQLRQTFYVSGHPCADCAFDFETEPQLVLLEGDSAVCGAAAPPRAWLFTVAPGSIETASGPLVGVWTGAAAWTDEHFAFGADGLVALDGSSLVTYRGELGLREFEAYLSGYDGRPFSVAGRRREAPVRLRRDWSAPLGEVDCVLEPSLRRVAPGAWLRMAQAEHAAVAAFARFSLDLLALGAPPQLLRDAHAAAADEVRHAQAAFAVAGLLAGEPVGPGPLDTAGCMADGATEEVFRRLLREGCIAETVSAVVVREMMEASTEHDVHVLLVAIAEDEARHAVLAWRAARWMLERWPTLRTVVVQELGRLTAEAPDTGRHPDALRAWGVLSPATRTRVRARVVRETVGPALERLATLEGAARVRRGTPTRPAR